MSEISGRRSRDAPLAGMTIWMVPCELGRSGLCCGESSGARFADRGGSMATGDRDIDRGDIFSAVVDAVVDVDRMV